MTMVLLDAIQQVARAFVKQLHQAMARVVRLVTMVIACTNTKLMVKCHPYIYIYLFLKPIFYYMSDFKNAQIYILNIETTVSILDVQLTSTTLSATNFSYQTTSSETTSKDRLTYFMSKTIRI